MLALAFTLQWVTVCIGLFYVAITGRPLQATLASDYQPMVLIGLGCLLALMAGLLFGQALIRRLKPMTGVRPAYALTFKSLVIAYVVGTFLAGGVQQLAWSFPTITQAIIAISFLRLGLLYLVLRRLVANDQWALMAGVLVFEIGLGFTGFHAGFREPLIVAVLAFLERFERPERSSLGEPRRAGRHAMGMLGVMDQRRVNYRSDSWPTKPLRRIAARGSTASPRRPPSGRRRTKAGFSATSTSSWTACGPSTIRRLPWLACPTCCPTPTANT